VIVADGASSDDSAAVARALGARIRDLPMTRERVMAALLKA
jgi:CO/xanthine dehydrogenase Mo-binding subunit